MLRAQGPLSKHEKSRRVTRLHTARRKVERCEQIIKTETERVENFEARMMAHVEKREEARNELKKAKEALERLETQFGGELEGGLWK